MENIQLSNFQARLLQRIQESVPLSSHPWDTIANELSVRPSEVRSEILSLRQAGVIREISSIFSVSAFGYSQSLVAFSLQADQLDQAGKIVALHPGVSHCYSRDDENYNLWFTLAVSPASKLGLEKSVALLAEKSGAQKHIILPTEKQFKLAVRFNFAESKSSSPAHASRPVHGIADYTSLNFSVIRALQKDLPDCERPFEKLALEFGTTPDEIFRVAAELKAVGALRRYAAVMHHRAAGANANVMVVWQLKPETVDIAGVRAAKNSAVSHCYTRPTYADWPYNLYTMIHGSDTSACLQTVDEIARTISKPAHKLLWTVAEYKKARVKIFTPDEENWERANTKK